MGRATACYKPKAKTFKFLTGLEIENYFATELNCKLSLRIWIEKYSPLDRFCAKQQETELLDESL